MEMERKTMREGQMQETGTVKDAFTRLKADVKDISTDVKDISNRLVNVSREKARTTAGNVNRFIHDRPYLTAAISAGAALIGGTLFGWLLRRRKP